MVIRSSNGLLRSDWTMSISRGSRINRRRMLPDPTAQTHLSRNPRSVLMDIFHPPPRLHSFFFFSPSDPLPSPPMLIPLVPFIAATHPSEPRRHPLSSPPSLSPRLPRPRPTSRPAGLLHRRHSMPKHDRREARGPPPMLLYLPRPRGSLLHRRRHIGACARSMPSPPRSVRRAVRLAPHSPC